MVALSAVRTVFNVHKNVNVEHAGAFLITMGKFAALPITTCCYIPNLRDYLERSVGFAFSSERRES